MPNELKSRIVLEWVDPSKPSQYELCPTDFVRSANGKVYWFRYATEIGGDKAIE